MNYSGWTLIIFGIFAICLGIFAVCLGILISCLSRNFHYMGVEFGYEFSYDS